MQYDDSINNLKTSFFLLWDKSKIVKGKKKKVFWNSTKKVTFSDNSDLFLVFKTIMDFSILSEK